jgi:putative ABC transport system substrate-binding protein
MEIVNKSKNAKTCCLAVIVLVSVFLFSTTAFGAGKTIGVIMTGDIPYYQAIHKAFTDKMSGKSDVEIIVQTPAPEPMAWANSAKKLVTIGSDLIVTYGAPATLSTMKATSSIPILFAGVYDPKAMNIAGKNATGVSSKVSLESAISHLKQVSNVKNLGVIFNKTEKDTILQVKEVKRLSARMGFKMVLLDAKKKGYAAKASGVDAMLLTTSCGAMCSVGDIISAARKARVPTAATIGGGEDKGILFTIMANPVEQGSVIADMALDVLGGQNPSGISVKAPSKIDFIVNLKEAAALGINVPGSIVSSATKVIK